MDTLKNLKLKQRILLGYSVPLILTISAAGAVFLSAKNLEQQSKATEIGWTIVQETDRLELAMYKRQASIRGYILNGEERFFEQYEESVIYYDELIKSLENLASYSGPDQLERLQTLKNIAEEVFDLNKSIIPLVKNGKIEDARRKFTQSQQNILLDRASRVLRELNNTEDKRQAERDQQAGEAMQFLIIAAVVGALSAAVLSILLGNLIADRITQKINETINIIVSSSSEIAATTEQHEHAANQQAASVHQTSTTMDELRASSRQAAQQAESATSEAQAIAQQIFRLSAQTKQIATINNLVGDLANQTNMLALNAAVEAVRAGEHGKGFAIVAAEIRKLADRSKTSAEKISTLLADIQAITDATVVQTSEGSKVESIVAAVNNIVMSNQQISLSAKQQAIAIEQVVVAMNVLNEGAVETACGISQTKIGIQKLNEAALNLKAVV